MDSLLETTGFLCFKRLCVSITVCIVFVGMIVNADDKDSLSCLVARPGYGLVSEKCPSGTVGCRIRISKSAIDFYEYSPLYDRNQYVCVNKVEFGGVKSSGCLKKSSGKIRCWCFGRPNCNTPEDSKVLYESFQSGDKAYFETVVSKLDSAASNFDASVFQNAVQHYKLVNGDLLLDEKIMSNDQSEILSPTFIVPIKARILKTSTTKKITTPKKKLTTRTTVFPFKTTTPMPTTSGTTNLPFVILDSNNEVHIVNGRTIGFNSYDYPSTPNPLATTTLTDDDLYGDDELEKMESEYIARISTTSKSNEISRRHFDPLLSRKTISGDAIVNNGADNDEAADQTMSGEYFDADVSSPFLTPNRATAAAASTTMNHIFCVIFIGLACVFALF